jgi:hypothetical protein
MKDIQAHLDKIRSDAAECLLLSSLATDGKREVFTRVAQHLNSLAFELEKTIATTETNRVGNPDNEEPIALGVAAAHPQKAARSRRLLLLLPVIVFGAVAAALVWADSPAAERYWSLLLSKHEPSPAPQDDIKQAIATLLSGEQAERKMLTEQVGALAARVGDLERTTDILKKASAEPPAPLNTGSVGAEEKPPNAETKPSAPEERPTRTEDSRTSTLETPARQMDGHPAASSDPLSETADRVGAIPRRVELDPRKLTTGPPGCTQFRSFDPASGTYTTLDGRRRQCR